MNQQFKGLLVSPFADPNSNWGLGRDLSEDLVSANNPVRTGAHGSDHHDDPTSPVVHP